MNRNKSLVFAAGAALAMLCGGAMANEEMMMEKWKKLDANSDGKVTMAEHRTHADAKFKKADGNSDSSLTQEEWMTAMKAMKEKKDGM